FYVNASLRPWERNGTPRRAGVSSFGIGGTNAHVIVEEAPQLEPASESKREWQVLALSAKTEAALEKATSNLSAHLDQSEGDLADVGYTLAVGRRAFSARRVVLCRDRDQALAALRGEDEAHVLTGVTRDRRPSVVLLYPGQGAQRVNMGRSLYESESVYRHAIDDCAGVLQSILNTDLRKLLFRDGDAAEDSLELQQTQWAQPVLFMTEYALTEQLRAWGVQPEALLGHSVGEWVAATVAGVFRLEDALRLVALRGQLMQRMEVGAMLSVALPEEEMEQRIAKRQEELGRVEVSAVNGAQQIVIGGKIESINRWAEELNVQNVWTKQLQTSHAYHTWLMEEAQREFAAAVDKVEKRAPRLNVISGVSGKWLTAEDAQSAEYWGRQMRERVRFASGVTEVLGEKGRVLVEAGPGSALGQLVRAANGNGASSSPAIVSLFATRGTETEPEAMLRGVAKLWLEGVPVKWEELWRSERRRRVKLPTYPFERVRCWVERKNEEATGVRKGRRSDIADWFYVPSWRSAPLPRISSADELKNQKQCWLVFTSKNEFGSELVRSLQQQGQEVISVVAGTRFAKLSDRKYKIDAQNRSHYSALLKELATLATPPQRVVHLWSLNAIPKREENGKS
ncbi:MAG TPA: type I polyketide synthase, partial [Pyrinomonadaceae bacterium]|nr:type I polyketide synthase [Pyrinomonadaceae bacterium]